MILNKETAAEVSKRALEINRMLNEIVVLTQQSATSDEVRALKLAVGKVSAELLFSLVNPLYSEHPELKPAGMA